MATIDDPRVTAELAEKFLAIATDEIDTSSPGAVDPERAARLAQTAALVSIARSLQGIYEYGLDTRTR